MWVQYLTLQHNLFLSSSLYVTVTPQGPYEYQNGDKCNITEMAKVGFQA